MSYAPQASYYAPADTSSYSPPKSITPPTQTHAADGLLHHNVPENAPLTSNAYHSRFGDEVAHSSFSSPGDDQVKKRRLPFSKKTQKRLYWYTYTSVPLPHSYIPSLFRG